MTRWTGSYDRDFFSRTFDSRSDAVVALAANAPGNTTFFIAKAIPVIIEELAPDPRVLLGLMSEKAFTLSGASSQDWPPPISNDAYNDLSIMIRRVLRDWAESFDIQPQFFQVEDVEELRTGDW